MRNKIRAPRGAPLDRKVRARLRRMIDELGVPETSRHLHVATNVVIRAQGGLPILLGSAALIRAGLSTLARSGKGAAGAAG